MRKPLQKIVLGISLLAISCCKIPGIEDSFLTPNYQTMDVNGVLGYVAREIDYLSDEENYGRSYLAPPEETFERKAGDCDDFCILDLYLLKRDLDIDGTMVCGVEKREVLDFTDMLELIFIDKKHAWVRVKGIDYEPQIGLEYNFNDYYVLKEYSYDEIKLGKN